MILFLCSPVKDSPPVFRISCYRVIIMKRSNRKVYLLWILLAEAVGGLSGWLSRRGQREYTLSAVKPHLSPPPLVFPIVWGILYALMGIGAARVYLSRKSSDRSRGLNLFVIQLAVNFFWSLIFFNAQAYLLALIWLLVLWGLVYAMIRAFSRTDILAARLQVLYLLWLSFALWLNGGTAYLN